MKLNINNLLMLLFISSLFFACSKEEVDVSTVTSFKSYSIAGLPDNLEVSESDDPVTLNFTFDADQIVEVSLSVGPTEGSTATEDSDYELSDHSLTYGALSEGGSFVFTPLADFVTEGDEKVFLTIASTDPTGLPTTEVIEITIKDVVSTDLVLNFDWEGDFLYGGGTYTLCPNLDLDFLVLDTDVNDLGMYGAATGACPEQLILSGLADGTYVIGNYMWSNGLAGLGLGVDFPVIVNAFKQDVFDVSYTPATIWTSEDPDQANGGNNEFIEVARILVSGDTFTVTAPDGTVVASGLFDEKIESN